MLGLGLLLATACGEDDLERADVEDAGRDAGGALEASPDGGVQDAHDSSTQSTSPVVLVDAATMDAGAVPQIDAGDAATSNDAGDGAVALDSSVKDPGDAGDGDFTVSTFTIQPELANLGKPRGKSFQFLMDSTKSKVFDGSDKTLVASKPRNLTRQINVYIPAQYKDGTKAPLLIIQDGPGPIDLISRGLDNLTISTDEMRRIPAFIAIAVQNGGNDAQGSERGLEYDTLSDRYARFIQEEVLPAVLADAKIKAAYPKLAFTEDPEGKASLGCSSGAAAAFTMAWFRPDLFRKVLSYSGTFVAQQTSGQPEAVTYPLGAWEYHSSKKIIDNTTPNVPIRAFLNVNEQDLGYNAAESGHHNWVLANQRMAAVLKDKGYHYRYAFAKGLGHCDGKAQQATLADALVWLWAGYPH
jgi:enterochelin esterase-like enzyme